MARTFAWGMVALTGGCSLINPTAEFGDLVDGGYDAGQIEDATTSDGGRDSGTDSGSHGDAEVDAGSCVPGAEVCNGVDDDCDGRVDEGDLRNLCAEGGVACIEGSCLRPVQLAAGSEHVCLVAEAGDVWCWGSNRQGQLCAPTVEEHATRPTRTELANATSIALGDRHTCARDADGAVYCCGDNDWGQLGDGSRTPSPSPVRASPLPSASSVGASSTGSCAISSGELLCWGREVGTTNRLTRPVPVPGLSDISAVSGGQQHFCAIAGAGRVACWGSNSFGVLGDGTSTPRPGQFVTVMGLTSAVAIDAGNYFTCALTPARDVGCWGINTAGQIGDGSLENRPVFTRSMTAGMHVTLAAGNTHVCATSIDGRAQCWGSNVAGALGHGGTETESPFPVGVRRADAVVLVASGGAFSCATFLSAVQCWGANDRGQLGDGSTANSSVPVQVAFDTP
ncbi:MAG: hypothetical protein KF729_36495 [Sandaracinaceae bacterium]|nr:hypothetical protein [Sandaracinaceae bacterium]